jgi:arsenate reductase (thioredoxin)
MDILDIFLCLGDEQRLRILNLLIDGPLCVAHFQAILGASQVEVSKKLAYLRARGLVECRKERNWMIYSLPQQPPVQFQLIIEAVRKSADLDPLYVGDRRRLQEIMPDDRAPIEISILRNYEDVFSLKRKRKVLFLCTGNSARSIFAEHFLRQLAPDRFEVYSAGAHPKGEVDPLTLAVLSDQFGIEAVKARSKSLAEFRKRELDFVITLCDRAKEECPIWPSQPITAHWASTDPAGVKGLKERQRTFCNVAREIHHRVGLFANLPIPKLNQLRLQQATRWIATQPRVSPTHD